MQEKQGITRRTMLKFLALGSASWCFRDIVPALARTPFSDPDEAPFLLFCTFEGGWDQLLALDPRDANDFGEGAAIDPAYALLAESDPEIARVLSETGGSGLVRPPGSNIAFGPAIGRLAEAHFSDLCVVRGIDMGTLTHEVGRRYFLTGKFPRGLQASGSSLVTWTAAQFEKLTAIPNLVVGMETYNEGLASHASGLSIRQPLDLLAVLSSLEPRIGGESAEAIDAAVLDPGCMGTMLDGEGMTSRFLDAYEDAKVLASGELARLFDYLDYEENPSISALLDHFGIDKERLTQEMAGPKGQAFIAAQAITGDPEAGIPSVSQCVSIRLATNIDHHDDDYQTLHAPALRAGFDALSDLVTRLKAVKDARGKSFWERTLLVVSSEFARTPRLNSRGGRDHHLSSSCLVAGKGIAGNRVIGATDDTFFLQPIDPATGGPDERGVRIRPPDIHATLLAALGLPYDHIANQEPIVLEAMLR